MVLNEMLYIGSYLTIIVIIALTGTFLYIYLHLKYSKISVKSTFYDVNMTGNASVCAEIVTKIFA